MRVDFSQSVYFFPLMLISTVSRGGFNLRSGVVCVILNVFLLVHLRGHGILEGVIDDVNAV